MPPFAITWREIALGVVVLVLVLIGFGILAKTIHWPNEESGWPFVVALSAIIAFLPSSARILNFLQQSRASVEGPFGIKVNFTAAVAAATVGSAKLTDNLVQPGTLINESSYTELLVAAREATAHTIAIIDLEDGRAWYATRLFALAAAAEFLGAPRVIVLLGQRAGQKQRVGGWISPADVVRAFERDSPRYREVLLRARTYLYSLRGRFLAQPIVATDPPRLGPYFNAYADAGDAAIMFVLVDQMRNPEDVPPTAPLEADAKPPWITLGDAESMLDPWLVRDTLDLSKPEKANEIEAILSAKGPIIIAVRNDQYAGVIDAQRAERELLRQLVSRSRTS